MNDITADINRAAKKEEQLRIRRDDAAKTLNRAGYSSTELAARTTVQHSRIRQYVNGGSINAEFESLEDFTAAVEKWQIANAQLTRLRNERNRQVIERLKAGDRQVDVAADFNISQFYVSYITNMKQEDGLI